MLCACGSNNEYDKCCQPYLEGKCPAPTAEALMRSRYTAYTNASIAYIKETMAPEKQGDFEEQNVRQWATAATWRGLKIIASEEQEETATVEFIASYNLKGDNHEHHELASFRKDNEKNCWYFVDGHTPGSDERAEPVVTYVRDKPKVGRNEPCPCGSGKKYKKCCSLKD